MNVFNSTSVSNEKGFTLLEILIAIVLLAFVTLAVVEITDNAFSTKDRTTEINKNNLQIETAMSRFEWDLAQIYSPLYFQGVMNFAQNTSFSDQSGAQSGNQSGVQSGVQAGVQAGAQAGVQGGMQMNPYAQQYMETMVSRFQRDEHFQNVSKDGIPVPRFLAPEKNIFEFFTTSNRRKLQNMKQSNFAWVRYSLADQTEDTDTTAPGSGAVANQVPKGLKSFVRYFTADDPYSNKKINVDDSDKIKAAVLLRNVESLEFQFWDLNRRKWETSLRNIQGGDSTIRGVKIILVWYDSFGQKRTNTRIFRPHWPLVVPQDQNTATGNGTAGGVQGNVNGGSNAGTNGGAFGN